MEETMNERVWREGERIRGGDGRGYSDRVSDEQIREHIAAAQRDLAAVSERVKMACDTISFAVAVLALRSQERSS